MSKILFPVLKPFRSSNLKVDNIHTVYYEESGNPNGTPVLFVHGGPGIAPLESAHQFFDPKAYHVIVFHQRGCGKSRPLAQIKQNTTQDLIRDIEKIRKALNIPKWHLFGGSWGSTLSLAYAQKHPDRCLSLVLRGIFLGRQQELIWFFEKSYIVYPDYFAQYEAILTHEERKNRIKSFGKRLNNKSPFIHMPAALAWCSYIAKCSSLHLEQTILDYIRQESVALPMARIENHYFQNNIFLPENALLKNAYRLKNIPTCIVHGRYDMLCPLKNAFDLKKAMPHAKLTVIPDGSHSAFSENTMIALIKYTESMKFIKA